ncbi:glycosyltransferase family 25 protein [Nitratireductor thuwali]|uniref:Glycosyl transferase family 25 domain-containing protein n=1 Tax=Nitratireductor thuwali TaxID=2267699 RepID=A0ABY5MH39_9HYPH|nr:hypothetical protein NTH_00978 [Nitratireductor thuwali]
MRTSVYNIKAYIIHLHRATRRQLNVEMLARALEVPVTVLHAEDERWITPETLDKHVRRRLYRPYYPFPLNRAEVACFLSHRRAWRTIVEDGVHAGLILEDDAALTAEFDPAFDVARRALQNGALVRFPYRNDREHGRVLFQDGDHQVIEPNPVGLGMVAQLVSREAAQRLLIATRHFDRPVDVFAQMHWVTGIAPLSVRPSGIREVSHELGGSMLKQRKGVLDRISHEVLRPIYRRKVRSYSARRPA